MAIDRKHNALSASFMVLSFATAALLIVVQGSGIFFDRGTASSRNISPSADLPSTSPQPPAAQTANRSLVLQPGIAQILAASHPVALIRQSRLVVDLRARQVLLYQDDKLQATYQIAVGRDGWETPTGEFRILNMQQSPTWQNPITGQTIASGVENPLGSRWIGFWSDGTHQIGFHGTNQENLIGQAVSHGCIRMREQDIQALYTQVMIGTPVLVQ